ncbi:uroporphyrinogen-III synthase [Gilvimarinus polysaccharolyticus]|uniref:uroporphyrinogen-III synthase n=1 Tax=Gilvimarinus polysaccharolyticus TaxID=863921 RepID=UPI00067379ED|nr:uroporphyrinogen-III synthase [Gilvimarinus polysaccharolyticus]
MNKWRVIITRPEPQASLWQQRLAGEGLASTVVPVMAIVAVTDSAARERVKQLILNFDHYQKAIFVSRNAVTHACEWLDDYWPQLPMGVGYFAVGSGTAQQLAQADFRVTALGREDSAMNSEALLADPTLQQVDGEKIVIFRGVGGRDLLASRLRERGAHVDFCELYHRQLPADAQLQVLNALAPAARRQDILSVHSGESLQNLMQTLAAHPALADYARAQPLLVPGERVALLGREMGFKHLLVAYNAGDSAMLKTLTDYIHN